MSKPEKPQLAFFAPQFFQLMIGSSYHGTTIKDGDDVCRFAADCGITGINLPIGMIDDVDRMISDAEFREQTVAHYRELGTPLVGLSSHTDGQLTNVHSAYLRRFTDFAPKKEQKKPRRTMMEKSATRRIIKGLELGSLLGTTLHQTFPGGRGVPHHDQWSTLPKHFREYAILHLAIQWKPIIEAAKEFDQRIAPEIGHVMEGIQTVDDLVLMRSYLPIELRPYLKWGVDTSHFDKEDDEGASAVDEAIRANIDAPGHAKSAVFVKTEGARHRQNGLPFSRQAGKFAVFGTVSIESAKKFGEVLWRDHARTPTGSHGVIEGESMIAPLNPFQGMSLAAENLQLIIDGKDPRPMSEVEIEPWDGPTFETFAVSSVPISALLELSRDELRALARAAREHGLPVPK